MSAAASSQALSALARAFVQAGRLHQHDAETVSTLARDSGVGFVEQLISAKKMSALEVAQFASDAIGYPFLNLSAYDQSQLLEEVIDRKLVAQHRVLALARRGNRLAVAISDPTNQAALDQIKFQTSLAIDPVVVVVEDDKRAALITALTDSPNSVLMDIADEDLNLEFAEHATAVKAEEALSSDVDDAPVVRFLQKMLMDAIREGASDLHFEPYEKYGSSDFRVGDWLQICTNTTQVPFASAAAQAEQA